MKRSTKILIAIVSLLLITGIVCVFALNGKEDGGSTIHTHEYTLTKFDETSHWFECSCGEKNGVENHKGGEATCTERAECSVCEKEYGELEKHDYTELKHNATEHWYVCVCGDNTEATVHSGGKATCTEKAKCSVCGEEYGELGQHTYDTEYSHDENRHWKEATCGCDIGTTYEEHGTEGNNCAVCEYPTKDTDGIIYQKSWDGTYADVIGYEGSAKKIRIAKTYQGAPVRSISYNVFEGTDITFVIIPDGVKYINEFAFYECTSLKSVVIPDSVEYIGGSAFWNCVSLKSVVIPSGVTTIEDGTFTNCSSLKSVVIGESVESIGVLAFSNCASMINLVIPDSVTSIASAAFGNCASLASVVIGESVESIGLMAFEGCNRLVEVVNKSSHITIEKGNIDNGSVGLYALAVYNSGDEFIGTKLSNDNGYIIYTDGAEKILVEYSGKETDLVLPSYITKINDYAFQNCDSLTSVVIGESVTSIGDEAFWSCNKLVEVVNKSTHITVEKGSSSNGFVGCYALAVYNSGDTYISKLSNDNGYIIYTDGADKILVGYRGEETDLVLPSYITEINDYAFYNCDSLTSVVIPNSVTSIGDSAFRNCNSLTSVEIGDSVTGIGSSAFSFCDSLTSVVMPGSVESVGSSAFFECASLTSVVIGAGVKDIGHQAFDACYSLTSIEVAEENENYKSIDGNLYTKDGKVLVQYCIGKTETTFVIPNHVTRIGAFAFGYSNSLVSVVIPNSVKYIDNGVFYGCNSLTSVEIPNSVESIGIDAFSGCMSLTNIVIPDSVKDIGSSAFGFCSSLTSVEFKNVNGWSAGETQLSSTDLSNHETAAEFLTSTYTWQDWSRS